MLINVIIEARDSTATATNNVATGLTPAWLKFSTYSLVNGTPTYTDQMPGGVASAVVPAVVPIQSGALGYAVWYDPAAHGEAIGQLDMGAALTNANDRYKVVQFAQDSQDIAQTLATVLGTGVVVKVSDTGATATTFKVKNLDGTELQAAAGDLIGRTAFVMNGTGKGNTADVTASTATPVQITVGAGLPAAPDDNAKLWILG